MTHNSDTKIHHDPLWLLRGLYYRHSRNQGKGAFSKSSDALRKAEANPVVVQDIRQVACLAELSLPNLIGKLRGAERSIVSEVVDELRARGHLSDGKLSWAYLRYVNLRGTNLRKADLKNANLERADMEMADLSYANLNDAKLTRASLQSANLDKASMNGANLAGAQLHGAKNVRNEQLAQASRMRGSVLPDGSLYDGRFNLPGDFADACILRIDLNDPAAIALFYGVSLEGFLHGQEWRLANMPSVSAWQASDCYQNAELIMQWL